MVRIFLKSILINSEILDFSDLSPTSGLELLSSAEYCWVGLHHKKCKFFDPPKIFIYSIDNDNVFTESRRIC